MRNPLSKTALAACCIIIFFAGFIYYPKWKQQATEATISWDVSGYYMYLPAVFIYHDLKKCGFADTILNKYRATPDFQQAFQHPSGNYVMKYTMGQAILFAPCFFAAHLFALAGHYSADGFSYPYQFAIGLGMLVYSLIGLWFLRRLLLRFFSDGVVAASLLVLVTATNYLNYAAIDGAMTHNTLFTLYAVLLYSTAKFYEKPGLLLAMMIGFITGLAVLIRPTEIICLLIPLLWGIKNLDDCKKRWQFIWKHKLYSIGFSVCFALVIFCQLVYWKWSSGEWIVYSYQHEGFNWLHPHLLNGLFSYKGGWLTYTPVMLLCVPGFIFLYRHYRNMFWCMVIFSSLFLYSCFSWEAWWYGASVGQRAIVQAYPVLSFTIAAFFTAIAKRRFFTWITILFVVVCGYYNCWLTHQAHRGGLFRAGEMTGTYFWAILGKNDVPNQIQALLDNEEECCGDTTNAIRIETIPASHPEQVDKDHPFSTLCYLKNPPASGWLRATFSITTPRKEWDVWKMPQAIVRFYLNQTVVKTNMVRISRILSDGEMGTIRVDARIPPAFDQVSVFVWNPGSEKGTIIHAINVCAF